ncbi:MAG TPA: proline dehydrogenase family protein [Chitinophagaceae bacterium]|jgi:proline dehydrogenase|nr:proline dehydrogenase family protein [Chitinophagaceae bacterium]
MDPNPSISFDNTENAFAYKTDNELKRARFLFNSMSFSWLVKIGTRVTPWAIRSGLPLKGLIRNTIFKQFVGGETLEETANVAKRLGEFGVQVILDYGVEGGEHSEEAFEHATDEFIRVINYAGTQANIPYMSVKITGIARFGLLEKLDHSVELNPGSLMKRFSKAVESLTADEKIEWHKVQERLLRICKAAAQRNVGVFIDAEETWIQDPIDVMTILMMEQFNKNKIVVYNTLQLYRHDRLEFLKDSYEAAVQRNFILGAKIVRGAYMEKERKRAEQMNYPSPIQPDKNATDKDFNEAIQFCIDHIDRVAVVVASHNEYSNLLTTQLLQKKNLPLNHSHVHFSQLYGMSDNITFNLATAGCHVSKYLPFGPIKDVIPYLMRRAQENTSVKGQTGRELALIKKEMKRRGL